MECCTVPELDKQKRVVKNYIQKYEIKDNDTSIKEWFDKLKV